MSDEPLDAEQENARLRKAFDERHLDLSEIYQSDSPRDLEKENRELKELLEWVQAWRLYPSRDRLEDLGFLYPPVRPDLTLDSDWLRFERWVEGKPVRRYLHEGLPAMLESVFLDDAGVKRELTLLIDNLGQLDVAVELQDGLPERVAYDLIWSMLSDAELEAMAAGGGVLLDGCDGWCPGCPQRPWCEVGTGTLFPEDEEADRMVLADELASYVCPAPGSVDILRIRDLESEVLEELEGFDDFDDDEEDWSEDDYV